MVGRREARILFLKIELCLLAPRSGTAQMSPKPYSPIFIAHFVTYFALLDHLVRTGLGLAQMGPHLTHYMPYLCLNFHLVRTRLSFV